MREYSRARSALSERELHESPRTTLGQRSPTATRAGVAPRCSRTPTSPASCSRSPTTSMNGILRSSASRILRPTDSVRSSSSTRRPAAAQRSRPPLRVLVVAVGDRQHDHLQRRQPERQLAGEVLEQDPDEALVGAHQRAVDHHRLVLGVVGAGVGEAEALGQVVVELAGAELPGAAERVGHVHVDLRAVEGAVARVEVYSRPWGSSALRERRLAVVPELVGADALARAASRARAGRRGRRSGRWRRRTRARPRPRPGSGPRCRRCGESSWAKWRTRSRPCSVPLGSRRCSSPGSQ